jgi:hypothetical protein
MTAFGQFLEAGSVAPGTRVNYRQGWALWLLWLATLLPPQRPINAFMDNVVGDRDKALYLLAFAMHLYETRGWRGKQVTHFFGHLRHHFFGAVRSTAFLDHPLVGKIRDAVKMDHSARVEFWVNTLWNEDRGRGRKATYLAGSMLMDTGKRASSATGPATDALLGIITDHGLRTAQVEATVSRGGKTFTLAGAPALRSYLLRPRATEGATEELRFPGVQSIRITFLTEKVVRDKGIPEPLFYGRRQERESRFMDDLLEWVRANDKLTDDDYLFTTYQRAPKSCAKTDKRLLQRRDLAEMFKAAAQAHGLDPQRFSTSSARRFAASNKGLSRAEVKVRGGWADDSNVPEAFYMRDPENRGAFAAEGGELTQTQLELLASQPLMECPAFSSDEDSDSVEAEDGSADLDLLHNLVCSRASAASPPPSPTIPVVGKKRILPASFSSASASTAKGGKKCKAVAVAAKGGSSTG